jgi:ATP-dependent Clp protease ATP-binding subunit ClpA
VRQGTRKIPKRTFHGKAPQPARHGSVRPRHSESRTFVPDERGLRFHQPTDEMNSMTTAKNITEARMQAFLTKAKDGIFGQDAAIDALAAELARRLETRSDHRPLGVILLAGPDRSGTKADLVEVLADALGAPIHQYDLSPPWGGEDALIFGLHPGVPAWLSLQQSLTDHPRAIVVLKAVEQADPTVLSRLLAAWTSDHLVEPSGTEVATTEAIFILTTEVGQGAVGQLARQETDPDRLHVAAVKHLADAAFPIPVLRSLDAVIGLKSHTTGELTREYCRDLADQVSSHGLELADGGIDARIVTHALEPAIGAYAKGEKRLRDRLDPDLVRAKAEGTETVRLVLGEDGILVVPVDRPVQEEAPSSPGSAAQEGSVDE